MATDRPRIKDLLLLAELTATLTRVLLPLLRYRRKPAEYEFKSDARLLLDVAREQFQIQQSFIDALDTKIATMFAVGSALLGLLAAVFAVRPDEFDHDALAVVVTAGSFYALLTLAAVSALWVREFSTGPTLPSIWEDAQLTPEEEFVPKLVADYSAARRANDKLHNLKVWATRAAIICVVAETATLVAALVVATS